MALVPTAMQATMLARALAAGLFDKPPNFGLSRVYGVIAKGLVRTAVTPAETITTVSYVGQPIVPPALGTATVQGVTMMDRDQFKNRCVVASLFLGPASVPFFEGIAGIVDYFMPTVTLLDLFAPIGSQGQGTLLPGGIVFDAVACFANILDEAKSEKIMVVEVDVHLGGNPDGVTQDPVTQETLHAGDFFSQARQLVLAVSSQFQVEVAKAQQPSIPVAGLFLPPPIPPITASTITTVLL